MEAVFTNVPWAAVLILLPLAGGIVCFLWPRSARVTGLLVAFTIVTIIAWLVIWVGLYVIRDGTPFFSHDSIYGVPSKIDELILLALLWNDKP